MIISKFGGTAMAPQNFCCLQSLAQGCGVVVSAVGKESPSDTKVTDLLLRHWQGDATAWQQVENKFRRLVQVNGVKTDVDRLLFEAHARSKTSLAHCLSLGEELTAKIAADYLECAYLEAEQCVKFCGNKLRLRDTLANLESAFRGVKRGVMGGFYGGGDNGRQLFPRGGGDVSGALAAAACGTLYQNWTDVCGVCNANPKRISGAKTLPCLSYRQMYCLARGGAEVLHPLAVRYAEAFGVTVVVGNYLRPEGATTVVSYCPCREEFLSVTERQVSDGVVATVLHAMPQEKLYKCLQQVAAATNQGGIVSCNVSKTSVQLKTRQSILPVLYGVFAN